MSDIDYSKHCPVCGSVRILELSQTAELVLARTPRISCLACDFSASAPDFRATQELRARESRLRDCLRCYMDAEDLEEDGDIKAIRIYRTACFRALEAKCSSR